MAATLGGVSGVMVGGARTERSGEVAESVPGPLDQPWRYGVYSGVEVDVEGVDSIPRAAQLGLEPPRFCGQCGRRMVVQVRPDGWDARCSRHGTVDSTEIGHP